MAKALTMKGIVRSQSKLAVQDGCAEDLINLRFKDGSWRTVGDGKKVYEITSAQGTYSQLYIHTCKTYRHLLGVKQDADGFGLYWFAHINEDNETFVAETTPQKLCSVSGDGIFINQTGHLLTIIDGDDDFEYVVFKTGDEEYKVVNVDTNGDKNSRSLYPFGNVHFNLQLDNSTTYTESTGRPISDQDEFNYDNGHYNNLIKISFNKAKEASKFTGCFFAIAAVKLYDGTYAFASNPVLLHPREYIIPEEGKQKILVYNDGGVHNTTITIFAGNYLGYYKSRNLYSNHVCAITEQYGNTIFDADSIPTLCIGGDGATVDSYVDVYGSDLLFSISNYNALKQNNDIFTSVCIFITKEINLYDLNADSGETGTGRQIFQFGHAGGPWIYLPHFINKNTLISRLLKLPFNLLAEYKVNELDNLYLNPVVDLSSDDRKDILKNLDHQETLTYESQSRLAYIPKVSYSYNGKLHIANYKSIQFHGYPIESFMLNNRSLKYQSGSTYEGLQNLADNDNQYYQFANEKIVYMDNPSGNPPAGTTEIQIPNGFRQDHKPLVVIVTELEIGENQTQKVCRYIETPSTGNITIHSLNALISFPDSRAKKITVYMYKEMVSSLYRYYYKEYSVLPHPYLNIAYKLETDLKPLDFVFNLWNNYTYSGIYLLKKERYNIEHFPNNIKVSKTNNPFFFPTEQAYQVGNGTILAMCSNSIAVGAGQTGSAPLYVFCTDGIYAMYVDQTGEMAYTNARVIARDVCNHAKSVTPTDAGVVFTTDRGLMNIAGEVVEELGQPAEGDVQVYNNTYWGVPDNVGKNILTKVAELPNDIVDGVDFLQYLKDGDGAIVNYNHNERELYITNPRRYKSTERIPSGKSVGDHVYRYTYVLDRDGNWTRRNFVCDEYVNNYPTSYRYEINEFFKVDCEEGQLEGKSEAPNKFLYLSNVIKVDTLDFKEMHRFVVRGSFNTYKADAETNKTLGCYVLGSLDGKKFALLGANEKKGKFTDIGCHVERTDVKFYRVALAGYLTGDSRIDYMEIDGRESILSTKIR